MNDIWMSTEEWDEICRPRPGLGHVATTELIRRLKYKRNNLEMTQREVAALELELEKR